MKNQTTVDRKPERELVVTRTFGAPAHLVFEAWTQPELRRPRPVMTLTSTVEPWGC
jgi:hypothetical protein